MAVHTRIRGILAAVIAAGLLALTACTGTGTADVRKDAEAGHLTIGVAFDRPGLSVKTSDGTLVGFDVDVATYIAGELGVAPENIEWKEAPSPQRETLITTGQVDFVVAAYSINDERKKKVAFAGPYFIAGQSLLVRAGDDSITGPDDLDGKRLCAPAGSTPAQNIKKNYAAGVQLQEYDTNSACLQALRNGAIDAMTTDDIVLAGYAAANPGEFQLVGEPFTTERYGVGLAKKDTAARSAINDAIEKMIADGSWAAAFERNLGASGYPLPDPPQVDRYELGVGGTSAAAPVTSYLPQILRAFGTTIALVIPAAVIALVLGTILAAMRVSPIGVLRTVAGGYVEVIRNTPLTLIILFCSFGLAQTLGITLTDPTSPTSIADSAFRLSVLGLGAYTATFVCEVLRAGINTVAAGQFEAARALGFGFVPSLRRVVLPQAFRSVIGPLGSVMIALIKNSTVAAIIGVAEAALLMKEMIENLSDVLLIGAVFAAGFVILTLPTGLLFSAMAKRLAVPA